MKKAQLEIELTKAVRRYERAEKIIEKQIAENEGLKLSLASARMFVVGLMKGKKTVVNNKKMFKTFSETNLMFLKDEGNDEVTILKLEDKDAEIYDPNSAEDEKEQQ